MTDITPALPKGALKIQRYGPSGFAIQDKVYPGPIMVLPSHVVEWRVADSAALSAEDFRSLQSAGDIELLLVGTGVGFVRLPKDCEAYIRSLGIIPNAMDTGAACRTYNVLLSEGRRVAAALRMPVTK